MNHRDYLIAYGRLTRHLQQHRDGAEIKPIDRNEWNTTFVELMKAVNVAHHAVFNPESRV